MLSVFRTRLSTALAMTEAAYLEARRRSDLCSPVTPPSAWLTGPEYATLRHRLENAHAAAEAALVAARRRVRLYKGQGE